VQGQQFPRLCAADEVDAKLATLLREKSIAISECAADARPLIKAQQALHFSFCLEMTRNHARTVLAMLGCLLPVLDSVWLCWPESISGIRKEIIEWLDANGKDNGVSYNRRWTVGGAYVYLNIADPTTRLAVWSERLLFQVENGVYSSFSCDGWTDITRSEWLARLFTEFVN
jgi:hypothetical protein